MEPLSSDGLEVVEPSRTRPLAASLTRPPKPPADPRARSTSAAAQGARKLAQQPSQVIELGDSSEEELPAVAGARSARLDDEDDDEVVVLGGSAVDYVARCVPSPLYALARSR